MRAPTLWGIAAGLALWAAVDWPIFGAGLVAYVAVWLVQNYTSNASNESKRSRSAVPALLAAVVAATFVLARHGDALLRTEQIVGLADVLRERARVQRTPTISPPVIASDRPQTFFVRAEGTSRVAVDFGNDIVQANALGHGLFRIDYDPRKNGPPASTVSIVDDDRTHARTMVVHRPRHHPRYPCRGPDTIAVPSEETDELFIRRQGAWRTSTTADAPTACGVLNDGRLVVTHRYDPRVRIGHHSVDVGEGQTQLAHDETTVVVATRRAIVGIDVRTSSVTFRFVPPDPPDWLALVGDVVIATSRSRHTIHSYRRDGSVVGRSALGRPAIHLATRGDVALVLVTDFQPGADAGGNHQVNEQIVTLAIPSMRVLRRTPTSPMGALPSAIGLADEGVIVTFAGSDEVVRVIDGAVVARHRVDGATPYGVVSDGDGLIFASPRNGAVIRVRPDGHATWVRFEPTDERLRLDDHDAWMYRRGERAFYESTKSGLACATCHLHGDNDFATHDIGHATPRPTLGLEGSWGTAPYLRGASYSNIGALHDFAAFVLRDYERAVDDRPALLDAFVRGVVYRYPSGPLRPAGLDAFVRAGCAACHVPGAWTDLAQVPDALLFPKRPTERHVLDTPSLRGVFRSAPYLFDGRADSIEAVLFDHNPSGTHGRAADLDAAERQHLLDLLESL